MRAQAEPAHVYQRLLCGRRRLGPSQGGGWVLPAGALLLASCGLAPAPSVMDPHGPGSAEIAGLGWLLIGTATIICLLVFAILALGLLRGGAVTSRPPPPPAFGPPQAEARFALGFIGLGGVVLPAIVLSGTLAATLYVLASLTSGGPASAATGAGSELRVEVIGHLWWWEVRYPDEQVVTANEIHIPAGRRVRLSLSTDDLIHSFWVPQLQGKTDLIPGQVNTTWIQASRPGIYRGQCAEYCGLQHAHMAFFVIADEPATFAAWLADQRAPAAAPTSPEALQGAQVFAREGCITCHSVRFGTEPVGGKLGPDLTHLASRRTIAAGTLANTRGNLGGWIENSQAIKPGNKMPPMPLAGPDLQALLTYLESLH